jgi:hypothetical protein
MPEDMPEHMPEDMPGRMPEDMPDRMPEDLPVTERIDVMVGITRSKVISSHTIKKAQILPPFVGVSHTYGCFLKCVYP